MICEMCGAESEVLLSRNISSSVLQLCSSCSLLGSEPTFRESIGNRAYVAEVMKKRAKKSRYESIDTDEMMLVNDYGNLITKARENLKLTISELAERISEKKSIIGTIERGKLRPEEKLVRKLESFLKIKLEERIQDESNFSTKSDSKSLTMGDLLKKAMEEE